MWKLCGIGNRNGIYNDDINDDDNGCYNDWIVYIERVLQQCENVKHWCLSS